MDECKPLVSGKVLNAVQGEVTFPPWMMLEAREAWIINPRNPGGVRNVTGSHKEVAEIASFIGELGRGLHSFTFQLNLSAF